jgi:hypothetical protein
MAGYPSDPPDTTRKVWPKYKHVSCGTLNTYVPAGQPGTDVWCQGCRRYVPPEECEWLSSGRSLAARFLPERTR